MSENIKDDNINENIEQLQEEFLHGLELEEKIKEEYQDNQLIKLSKQIKSSVGNLNSQKKDMPKTHLILYLGNLPNNIDNYDINELITNQGNYEVESMSIKQMKDNSAYAYVKLKSKRDVEELKKKLHLTTFKDKIIKADAFKNEEKRKVNDINSNIYFKGFSQNSEVKEVLNLFSQFGEVNSIKPLTNGQGVFNGTGYISFCNPDYASNAISGLNGREYNGNKISVFKYNKLETRIINNSFPVIIVRNIPSFIIENNENTNDKIKQLLSKICEITLCGIYKELHMNDEIYSAIVLLPGASEVEKAILNSKDPEINNYHLEIFQAPYEDIYIERLAQAKKNNLKIKYAGANLIVKNLPKELNEKELYAIFSNYGKVKSVKIVTEGKYNEKKDSNGIVIDKEYIYESKGFGYVLFIDVESASKAIDELNNVPYMYKDVSMLLKLEYFNYDHDKEKKKQDSEFKKKDYNKNPKKPFKQEPKFINNNPNYQNNNNQIDMRHMQQLNQVNQMNSMNQMNQNQMNQNQMNQNQMNQMNQMNMQNMLKQQNLNNNMYSNDVILFF